VLKQPRRKGDFVLPPGVEGKNAPSYTSLPLAFLCRHACLSTKAAFTFYIKRRVVFCNRFHASHWITRLEVSAFAVSVNFVFMKIIESDEPVISQLSGLWTMEMIGL
jgi:hypothetical protein